MQSEISFTEEIFASGIFPNDFLKNVTCSRMDIIKVCCQALNGSHCYFSPPTVGFIPNFITPHH